MAHGASTPASAPQGRQQHYAVPNPMPWPIMGSTALFTMALGGVFAMNGAKAGYIALAAGFMLLAAACEWSAPLNLPSHRCCASFSGNNIFACG